MESKPKNEPRTRLRASTEKEIKRLIREGLKKVNLDKTVERLRKSLEEVQTSSESPTEIRKAKNVKVLWWRWGKSD